jgi:hypothetical protein
MSRQDDQRAINDAYDAVREEPPSASRTALESLLGVAAFRIASNIGMPDPLGAGCDAVFAVQVHVAHDVLYAKEFLPADDMGPTMDDVQRAHYLRNCEDDE